MDDWDLYLDQKADEYWSDNDEEEQKYDKYEEMEYE